MKPTLRDVSQQHVIVLACAFLRASEVLPTQHVSKTHTLPDSPDEGPFTPSRTPVNEGTDPSKGE
jgi:hypothetical protein